jgi:hypothetical protein
MIGKSYCNYVDPIETRTRHDANEDSPASTLAHFAFFGGAAGVCVCLGNGCVRDGGAVGADRGATGVCTVESTSVESDALSDCVWRPLRLVSVTNKKKIADMITKSRPRNQIESPRMILRIATFERRSPRKARIRSVGLATTQINLESGSAVTPHSLAKIRG